MAPVQRVIVPFNSPLSPGSPANDQGVRKIENLLPVFGGLRSIPYPSGDAYQVESVPDDQVEDGSVGLSTDEVSGAIMASGVESRQVISYFTEGALDSEPTIQERSTFSNLTPIIATRNSIFVGEEKFSGFTAAVGDDEDEFGFGYSAEASPWSMAQFGEYVVATNYQDPVLRIGLRENTETGASVSALINSLSRPRAKYLTVVGGHILLANLRFTVDTNANQTSEGVFEENPLITAFTAADSKGDLYVRNAWPNAIWWSAQNDGSLFTSPANANATGDETEAGVAIESLSDFEIIYDVAGEITGVIGFPEAAVIFQTHGSSLLQLTRGPEVFERRVLELGVGCTNGRSLVAVDQDVYFFSQDGFRVLNSFSKSSSIMDPQLRRELLDRRFGGDYAIRDSDQIKFSLWDAAQRVVFWFYENLDGKLVAAAYNVDSRAWSFIKDDELQDYFVGCSTVSQYPYAGIYMAKKSASNPHTLEVVRWQDGDELDEVTTIPARIRTKTFSLTPDQGQIGATTANILRIRPIYRVYAGSDPQVVPDPLFKITSSLDPNMRILPVDHDLFSKTTAVRQRDGWYRPQNGAVLGCAFEIEAEFPEAHDQSLWDIIGVQVEFAPSGES